MKVQLSSLFIGFVLISDRQAYSREVHNTAEASMLCYYYYLIELQMGFYPVAMVLQ
jgi:hypothetical protein